MHIKVRYRYNEPKKKSRQNKLAKKKKKKRKESKANNNNINSSDSKDKINTSRQGYWLNRPFPRFFSTFDMYKIGKILQQPYFQSSLLSGGREKTTGNMSAVRRLSFQCY